MRSFVFAAIAVVFAGVGAQAQDRETLADIRQQLTVLNVEIQRLKRELSTTGGASTPVGGSSVLARMDAIERELARLTGKTEELEHRVNRVIADGTNRIGDLEFRLVELEGGDVSQIGETSTLGGFETPAPAAPAPVVEDGPSLAVNEQADFDRARTAFDNGEYRAAADMLATYTETYPGGALAMQAQILRGQALEGAGELAPAARSYLAAYSGNPTADLADQALYHLGVALGRLGQTQEACVTLSAVGERFPGSEMVLQANSQKRNIGCP